MSEPKRLTRSESERMLAGICGGIARYFGLDPTLVRIGFVLFALLAGSGILAYIILWLVIPTESRVGSPPQDAPRDGYQEMRDGVERGATQVRGAYDRWKGGSRSTPPSDTSPPATPPPDTPPPAPDDDRPAGPPP